MIASHFFSKDLAKFHFTLETPKKWRNRGPRLNIAKIVEAIGDLLVDAAPLLETVTGAGKVKTSITSHRLIIEVSESAIVRWIPKLPHLRNLRLWDGKSLSDERIPNLLHVHCSKLEALSVYSWYYIIQACAF